MALLVSALTGACGSDPSPGGPIDGSPPDANESTDGVAADAPTDSSATEGGDGAPSFPPAAWSFNVQHAPRAAMRDGADNLWIEVSATTSVLGSAVTGFALVRFKLSIATGLPLGASPLKRFSLYGKLADYGLDEYAMGLKPYDFIDNPIGIPASSAPVRGRWDGAKALTFDSFTDSSWNPCISSSSSCQSLTQPGDVGIEYIQNTSDATVKTVFATGGKAVADSIALGPKGVLVTGRMQSGNFDFDNTQGSSSKGSGPGVFVASYALPTKAYDPLSLQWLKVFPATILPLIGTGNVSDEPGFGVRFAPASASVTSWLVTIPFQGTLDLGGGTTFTAPSSSFSTAVAGLDPTTGSVLFAKAFDRGTGSQGKPSHARVVGLANGDLVYVDTVWDTIDFGGTVVNAKQAADVVVAVLSSTGTLKRSWVYGGPGDDEALGVIADYANVNADIVLYGRSAQSIDFGKGPLSAGGDSEVWFARITP